jgi:hypothetical protein
VGVTGVGVTEGTGVVGVFGTAGAGGVTMTRSMIPVTLK